MHALDEVTHATRSNVGACEIRQKSRTPAAEHPAKNRSLWVEVAKRVVVVVLSCFSECGVSAQATLACIRLGWVGWWWGRGEEEGEEERGREKGRWSDSHFTPQENRHLRLPHRYAPCMQSPSHDHERTCSASCTKAQEMCLTSKTLLLSKYHELNDLQDVSTTR